MITITLKIIVIIGMMTASIVGTIKKVGAAPNTTGVALVRILDKMTENKKQP